MFICVYLWFSLKIKKVHLQAAEYRYNAVTTENVRIGKTMASEKSERLLSLDIFRGLTIAAMILVNNPGSWTDIYAPLKHADWHGCTPTDWIFPFFLFIVGMAITLSLQKRKERGDKDLFYPVVRRASILFLLGLFLNGFPFFDFGQIRIPGVLQRIGIVYFITACLFLKTSIKVQGITGISLLFIYWGLMTLIPVPGIGKASLEPTTSLAAWLDNLVLGGHLWSKSKVWDPEGILSTMPAISTAILGIFLGHWLNTKKDSISKAAWIFVFGNFLLVSGLVWDSVFPINKNLWTSSYVLYTGGIAFHVFGLCYWISDIHGYSFWTKPFLVYGSNAITVFFLSGICGRLLGIIKISNSLGEQISLKGYLYDMLFISWLTPVKASLMWAIVHVLFWLGIMWILYVKKIFIKI